MRPVGAGVNVNTIESPATGPSVDRLQGSRDDGFTASLKTAIDKVDEVQIAADVESSKLASGSGNLHETMLALEKADVTMKVAMKVRNKVIDAYNDVMRMSV